MIKFRRFKDKDIVNNGLHRWLTFFDKNTIKEQLKKMDTVIKKTNEVILNVAQNKDMLRSPVSFSLQITPHDTQNFRRFFIFHFNYKKIHTFAACFFK
jgi:hypothetical protein